MEATVITEQLQESHQIATDCQTGWCNHGIGTAQPAAAVVPHGAVWSNRQRSGSICKILWHEKSACAPKWCACHAAVSYPCPLPGAEHSARAARRGPWVLDWRHRGLAG